MGFGGIERSLIEFLRDLDYARYSIDLLLLYGPYDLCGEINPQVRLIKAESLSRKIRLHPVYVWYYVISMLFKLLKSTNQFKFYKSKKNDFYCRELYRRHCCKHYDTVIAYQQSFVCEYAARFVSADKKIMMYHHGEIQEQEYLEPWFRQADVLLTVGEGIAQKLAEAFPFLHDKILIIKNYENVDFICQRALEFTSKIIPEKLNLCTCGRISTEKGFDLAVEAAIRLKKTGLDFHWYFVGGGYDTFEMEIREKITALNLSDFITITGFTTNPYPYIKSCDILVVPSRFEANPLIIFEAKALLKTIVSTATNGAQKLLSHNTTGYICGFTPQEIADAILAVYGDTTIQDTITRNLHEIDYQELKEKYYQLWDEVL